MFLNIVILTVSSKHKDFCVAGIDYDTGDMIRLVSENKDTNDAIPREMLEYTDGSVCTPLDVVKVPILKPSPLRYQPENMLVDKSFHWEKIGKVKLSDVVRLHPLDNNRFIFGTASYITNESAIRELNCSLTIIQVTEFELVLGTNSRGDKRTKCRFKYYGIVYENMSVTDPTLYNLPIGYKAQTAVLVISIPFDEPWYKFVSKAFLI
jgi:hypothetical protein